jgi:hypothetical protein
MVKFNIFIQDTFQKIKLLYIYLESEYCCPVTKSYLDPVFGIPPIL